MKFLNSFWKLSFYRNKENKTFWYGLLRIAFINSIVGLVFACFFYGVIGKNIPGYFTSISNQVLSGYPSELKVSIKDGKLSKNIPGELKLYQFSELMKDKKLDFKNVPKYLVVINESKEASLATYEKSEAFIFLGKDGFVAKGNNNEIKMGSYKDVKENAEFSKATLVTIVNVLSMHVGKVAPVVSVAVVILYVLFVSIWQVLFTLLLGLVVMLFSKWIFGSKMKYGESYMQAFFVIPVISLFELLINRVPYISVFVSKIPLFTVILVVCSLWFIFQKTKTKEVAAE